jgi:hypothetical protein
MAAAASASLEEFDGNVNGKPCKVQEFFRVECSNGYKSAVIRILSGGKWHGPVLSTPPHEDGDGWGYGVGDFSPAVEVPYAFAAGIRDQLAAGAPKGEEAPKEVRSDV